MTSVPLTVAAIAAAALLGSAPFATAPNTLPPAPTYLTLKLYNAEAETHVLLRSVTLTCEPTGGTHPLPEEACRDLADAKGDVHGIGDVGQLCTDHLEHPRIASVKGWWQHQRVDEKVTFGNPCEFEARAGSVFRLEDRGTILQP